MSEKLDLDSYGNDYTNEADFLRSVDNLVDKLEFALDNDMDLKPYKLKELIKDVKNKKYIMLNCINKKA